MSGYYDYGYDYSYVEPAVDSATGFVLVFVLVFYLLMIGFSILSYVLNSLGMYTIAKRRGIHHAWLSWLPIGNMWVMGSISDQYQYIAKGRVRNRRKVLLGLTIGMYASLIPLFASLFAAVFSEVVGYGTGETLLGASAAIALLTYFVMIVLAIILLVFEYIALYDLFTSCDPGNAVMYLVLSIFLGVVLPFFMFACRKKDLGMPPRKPVQPEQPVFQPEQPVCQPTWQPQSAPAEETPIASAAEEEMPAPEQPAEEPEE